MRVLQVAHAVPSHTLGGTELYAKHLSESLAREHDVAVAAPQGDGTRLDVPFVRLPLPEGRGPLAVDSEAVERRFVDALDSFDPDVVHFQHLKRLSATLPERCRERGIPCVATLHDFWTICHREQLYRPEGTICSGPESVGKCADCYLAAREGRRGGLPDGGSSDDGALTAHAAGPVESAERAVERRTARLSDALGGFDRLIAPSAFLRDTFVRFGTPPERIVKRRNGILTERFADAGFDPSSPVRFGYAGRITELKGVHLLLRAFRAVDDDAELHVFGRFDPATDPYHAGLRELAAGDDRVAFHGEYDRPGEPYEHMDVKVLPSLWYENSPIVVQEAFASRVPIVTADVGGMAELVTDGRDGLTFRVGDREALAATLRRVVRSPSLIERLRRGIREPKHLDENTAETVALYRECLDGRGGRDERDEKDGRDAGR
ncbi:glycosyltransferase family 4 protein [Halegenticoccus soli]|uniref:glycosyltransferase family 4 protein n=1 Tax=Halegenticoccus soli TaxID=1985678 RepID=UPI000C6EA3F2|nr:glycosyltransferase family 4 protein [Halegenticoccus soli]